MYLYNIHTHNTSPEINGYKVKIILNTFPEEYYRKQGEPDDIWFSCGIHPWYADNAQEHFEQLKQIAKEERVVAIGEAGLDKLQGADINIQIEVFKKQIKLAEQVGKPLIIHCVKAWDELIALHKEFKTAVPWILHGYRGNPEQTKQLVKQGFKFSLGEKFNPDSLKHIPTDSIFCETDISRVSICQVYQSVSSVLDDNIEQFAFMVQGNMEKNFKIMTK